MPELVKLVNPEPRSSCHWYCKPVSPVAAVEKVTLSPSQIAWLEGCSVMVITGGGTKSQGSIAHGVKFTLLLIGCPKPEGLRVAWNGPVSWPHQLLVAFTVPGPVLLIPNEVFPTRQEFEICGDPAATKAPDTPLLYSFPFVKTGLPFSTYSPLCELCSILTFVMSGEAPLFTWIPIRH